MFYASPNLGDYFAVESGHTKYPKNEIKNIGTMEGSTYHSKIRGTG